MDYFVFIRICKFGSFKNPLLQQLLACLNFTLEAGDLSFWYKQKKWYLWTMAAEQAAENHADEWGLTWYFLCGIYTSILTRKCTSSSRSTKFKDILPWNISQMIRKTFPISTRIVTSYAMKRGIPLTIWWKVNGNSDNNMIRISQWRESHCRTNTSIRSKK